MRSNNLQKNASQPSTPDGCQGCHVPPPRSAPAETAILTRNECAAWLGISVRQLARLDIPCVKLGRLVRYSVPRVLRWADERGQL